MPTPTPDLWQLALDSPRVDASTLAEALVAQLLSQDLDYRTRLLIRDAQAALQAHWGRDRFGQWLSTSPVRRELDIIAGEDLGEPGFPSLRRRLVDATRPEHIRRYFRDLGSHLRRPVRLYVGGAVALILQGHLSRRTEAVDVVDEVPAEIRSEFALLAQLEELYTLHLGHFQQHYRPANWEQRAHSEGPFGNLQVFLIDAHDIFTSKLFSLRSKDRGDLHVLYPQLDGETLVRRLREDCRAALAEADLRASAEQNWYVLTGEPLPV